VLLSLDLGFHSPQIQELANRDPDFTAIRVLIRRLRPIEHYDTDAERAEANAWRLVDEICSLSTVRNLRGNPAITIPEAAQGYRAGRSQNFLIICNGSKLQCGPTATY
jgi:hypothetical protein